jgi:uncharacterized RDD family membrane protein YckC
MPTLLDSLYPRETPEGASLLLRPAGPLPRAAAFLIDLLLRLVMFWAVAILFSFADRFGTGLFLIALFLIEWFYPVVFDVWRKGVSPGKGAMGLAVVSDSGAPVSFGQSLTRNLLRAVDILPFGYLLGITSMLLTRDFRRLGDLAAGTLVVHRAPRAPRAPAPVAAAPLQVTAYYALSPEEEQQVATFAHRAAAMTPSRAAELAAILPPMVQAQTPDAASGLEGLISLGLRYGGRS